MTLLHVVSPPAGPLLDALGDSYAAGCEGSAFYALQSCLNHSCRPNAHAFKRDGQDTDGAAVILAKRTIAAGEEVGPSSPCSTAPVSTPRSHPLQPLCMLRAVACSCSCSPNQRAWLFCSSAVCCMLLQWLHAVALAG
jgi:hypothetical protein